VEDFGRKWVYPANPSLHGVAGAEKQNKYLVLFDVDTRGCFGLAKGCVVKNRLTLDNCQFTAVGQAHKISAPGNLI
jgi:hypothetical protein